MMYAGPYRQAGVGIWRDKTTESALQHVGDNWRCREIGAWRRAVGDVLNGPRNPSLELGFGETELYQRIQFANHAHRQVHARLQHVSCT